MPQSRIKAGTRDEDIVELAEDFNDSLCQEHKLILSNENLVEFTRAYQRSSEQIDFLGNYALNKFYALPLTPINLKRYNDILLLLTHYMNYLNGEDQISQPILMRFDSYVVKATELYSPTKILKSCLSLIFKNSLTYAGLLIDLGLITRNGLFDDVPEKLLIHWVAITGMFLAGCYECHAENNSLHWPDSFELFDLYEIRPGISKAEKQYNHFIRTLIEEIHGNKPMVFFRRDSKPLSHMIRMKKTEVLVRSIPRVYLGGLIFAPATIPMVIAMPLIDLGQSTPLSRTHETVICVSLAAYFIAFIYLSFSGYLDDILEQFIYCEEDDCFLDEAKITAAALAGGGVSTAMIFLYGFCSRLSEFYRSMAENPPHPVERFHVLYRSINGNPTEASQLLTRDVELGMTYSYPNNP